MAKFHDTWIATIRRYVVGYDHPELTPKLEKYFAMEAGKNTGKMLHVQQGSLCICGQTGHCNGDIAGHVAPPTNIKRRLRLKMNDGLAEPLRPLT